MILCGQFGQGSVALQVLGQAVYSSSIAAYDGGKFLHSTCSWPDWVYPFVLQATFLGYAAFWWCFAIIRVCRRPCVQPRWLEADAFQSFGLVFGLSLGRFH